VEQSATIMDQALIEVRDLSKSFNGHTVLDGVSLKLYKGEVMSIIGKSGVGKSVLLKHIIGLLEPDAGQILFNGQPVARMNSREKDAYLEKISFMFQNNALFNSQTVFENVAMPLRYRRGVRRKEIAEKVAQRLEQMELSDAAGKYPAELSGGMQKRVALARALISEPDIVLFDEPTTGQDPIRKNAILSMIAAYQQKFNFSAILISHDVPDVFFISNTILALYEGRIIFEGTPEAFEQFDHPFRTEFVQSLELLQNELTGMYSRRQFKVRYHTDLVRNPHETTYALALFELERTAELIDLLGHDATQELIAAVGTYINKHFSGVGGFSTRFSTEQFATVLPYADIDEAGRLIENLVQDLAENGLTQLKRVVPAAPTCENPVHIAITAGVAVGKPQTALPEVMQAARRNQSTIAEFSVDCRKE
jgi:phospholipid/cholesterol/gamma-HCH transport system ATP-binding protein